MIRKMKFAIAALTVALLSASPASYSDNSSHSAIVDAYDKTYGDASGIGLLVRTDVDGETIIRLMNVKDDPIQLCDVFGDMSNHIIVIDSSLNEMHYDCSI